MRSGSVRTANAYRKAGGGFRSHVAGRYVTVAVQTRKTQPNGRRCFSCSERQREPRHEKCGRFWPHFLCLTRGRTKRKKNMAKKWPCFLACGAHDNKRRFLWGWGQDSQRWWVTGPKNVGGVRFAKAVGGWTYKNKGGWGLDLRGGGWLDLQKQGRMVVGFAKGAGGWTYKKRGLGSDL